MKTEFTKVPFYIEADGSKTFFLPDCSMVGGFKIGPKEKEETVVDYWDALSRVSAMVPPRFRRKNKSGNFGVIVCRPGDFEEVSRDFIEKALRK